EPKPKNRSFAQLADEQQQTLRAVAGVLRLARGLRKCGVEGAAAFRADRSVEAVQLEVPGPADSVENVARLAVAKHLLENYLQVAVILKPIAPVVAQVANNKLVVAAAPTPTLAAASD